MSVWDEIKAKLDVVDVLGEYIDVQSSGMQYRAVCPFHREKTPSLMISQEKQIWHCFGCGAGGDIFKFVAQIENAEKKDVLKKLAQKAGVKLDTKPSQTKQQTKEEVSLTEAGYKILTFTAQAYHKVLVQLLQDRSHPISKYVIERGLSLETIKKFQIGYAPRGGWLSKLAVQYQLPMGVLQKTGVVKEDGKDKFSDRLMIPIFDVQSRVVGFTGRVLPYDTSERPKYLNSAQSEWFNKSQLWFGLNFAGKKIRQEKKAILVEGNMDVIAAHQAGWDITIASQGTSFTQQQLKKLKSFTKTVYIAFDNDNAGLIAGKKLYFAARNLHFEVQKLMIPDTFKDIDEYIQSGSAEQTVVPFAEYMIQKRRPQLQSDSITTKREAIVECMEVCGVLDAIQQDFYKSMIAQISGISKTSLDEFQPTNDGVKTEVETDDRPTVSDAQVLYQNFQKYAVTDAPMEEKVLVWNILSIFVDQMRDFVTADMYFEANQDELGFIKQETSEYVLNSIRQVIMQNIDERIGEIMINPQAQEWYQQLKRLG